jgi:hypothetical protein
MKSIPAMVSRTIVTLLSLILATGCAQLEALFKSTPPLQPPMRQGRQEAPPQSAQPPMRQGRKEAPPSPARPEQLEPPPRLSLQIYPDREKPLMEEANTLIHGAHRTLLSIDQHKLNGDQSETYDTIHSFLTQARIALSFKDFPQAMNLAQKARVLSEELHKTVP